MKGFEAIRKVLKKQGNSLVVVLSSEAKQLGLKEHDSVYITLDTLDEMKTKQVCGAAVLSCLESGHIMKSVPHDGSDPVYLALDPMRLVKQDERYTSKSIYVALTVPTDLIPKDVWALTSIDIIDSIYNTPWVVCDEVEDLLHFNTRAYMALRKDAIETLKKEGTCDITGDTILYQMLKLNDIGWFYDAANDKGVYDAQRL